MTISNRERIIPSGLSVIGWYTELEGKDLVSVHVDIGFGVGKFGGEVGDLVEFELRIKRAEIVVICAGGAEPKYSTMARPNAENVWRTEKLSQSLSGSASGQLELGLGGVSKANLNAHLKGEKSFENTTTEQVTSVVSNFLVRHQKSHDGHPSWEVKSKDQQPLDGNPWNPNLEPRIQVKMPSASSLHEPILRVEVRCRGEDLDFGKGIKLKKAEHAGLFSKIKNSDKNLAAAEQYLKQVLQERGLLLARPSEKYGAITLADVVLTVE